MEIDQINLKVKIFPISEVLEVDAQASWSVKDLKEKVSQQREIPVDKIRFVSKGKIIEEDTSLEQSGLLHQRIVTLVPTRDYQRYLRGEPTSRSEFPGDLQSLMQLLGFPPGTIQQGEGGTLHIQQDDSNSERDNLRENLMRILEFPEETPRFGGMPPMMGGLGGRISQLRRETPNPREAYAEQIQTMKDMGFEDEERIVRALSMARGNLEVAVNLYVSQED